MRETQTQVKQGQYESFDYKVVFGKSSKEAVLSEVDQRNAKRVFLVSNRSLSQREDGPLQDIVRKLGPRYAATHLIQAHTPYADVIAGAKHAREIGADLIVSIGGSSAVDGAKGILFCLCLGIESAELLDTYPIQLGLQPDTPLALPSEMGRIIAVPTTLSAGEFTSSAGLTDVSEKSKRTFRSALLMPEVIILDPRVTIFTPIDLFLSTGLRAIDHAVEGYCSPQANLATEPMSLHALKLLYRSLLTVKANPEDLEARFEAQVGMWQAVIPLGSGVIPGASHAISYVIGSTYDVAHGRTSCVTLPAVLRWNSAANADRQCALSESMGSPTRPAYELVAELVTALGQSSTLRDLNIRREQISEIAELSIASRPEYFRQNPRLVRGTADVEQILEIAW